MKLIYKIGFATAFLISSLGLSASYAEDCHRGTLDVAYCDRNILFLYLQAFREKIIENSSQDMPRMYTIDNICFCIRVLIYAY